MPTLLVVGVGEKGYILIGPWGYLNWKLPFVKLS